MKIQLMGLALCVLASVPVATAFAEPTPLSIDDIFQAALKRSETVATQEEAVVQANELHTQALGSLLPNLSGTAYYFDQSQSSSYGLATTTQKQAKLTATQPIFAAQAYPGLEEADQSLKSQQEAAKETRITLFQNVLTQFYAVLAAERDIADLNKESKMYIDWVKQLQSWVAIGRARPSDVTQIQASLYSLYATLEASKLTLMQSRQSLAFFTGLPRDTSIQDPYPEFFDPELDPLEGYVGKVQARPDVKTFVYARDAADSGIDVAKAGHLPSVNLTGDYFMASTGTQTQGGTYDFQLTLTLPIFEGGVVQSKVRQAASQYRQGELSLSQNMRQADEQIRTYYDQVKLDHSQVIRLKDAKDYAWTNYLQEMHDFRLGLVTNIDVLTSMTTFENNERTYDKEKFQEKADYLFLMSAVGKLKDPSLAF